MLALPLVAATGGIVTGAPAGASTPMSTSRRAAPQPPIVRRAEWGGDLRPKSAIPTEEVKFLLVHHTAEPGSDYQPDEVVGMLRSIYAFHTGASKGWPDVAYNFFVDKFGTIYEGRSGSVDGPLRGSATGGNQGYSQLCCFIGDYSTVPPPAPALASMYSLLAWLADRYSVDTSPGAQVRFTSLGSNKWPAGSSVDAATICAHRDMSETTCPGDACYALVRSTFPSAVSALRNTQETTPPSIVVPSEPTVTQPEPNTSGPDVTEGTDDMTTKVAAGSSTTEPAPGRETSSPPLGDGSDTPYSWPLIAAAGLVGAGIVGGTAVARRRRRAADDPLIVAWRISGGAKDPLVHALATTGRSVVASDEDWWDDLAEQWHVGAPVAVNGDTANPDPSSFLVASDGRRALVRLTGDANGIATAADGSTTELSSPGVTKVWLTTAKVALTVDGQVTELTQAGAEGPVDRSMRPTN